jgi:uracil phosphoribosyltransferase
MQKSSVTVCNHPLIQHKLAYIRDKQTSNKDFRELVSEVAMLITYEVTRDLRLRTVHVETPVATTEAQQLDGMPPSLIPILRAGLGLVEGVQRVMPQAVIGHIGLRRNEQTLQPEQYYFNLPPYADQRVNIVLDPMLATGGSANAALTLLKQAGCTQLKLMCMIAAPEGIAAVQQAHPDVPIYIAAIDDKLNEHGYIVPGLGDAGDRIFGTNLE